MPSSRRAPSPARRTAIAAGRTAVDAKAGPVAVARSGGRQANPPRAPRPRPRRPGRRRLAPGTAWHPAAGTRSSAPGTGHRIAGVRQAYRARPGAERERASQRSSSRARKRARRVSGPGGTPPAMRSAPRANRPRPRPNLPARPNEATSCRPVKPRSTNTAAAGTVAARPRDRGVQAWLQAERSLLAVACNPADPASLRRRFRRVRLRQEPRRSGGTTYRRAFRHWGEWSGPTAATDLAP